jgi:hypothetical protein
MSPPPSCGASKATLVHAEKHHLSQPYIRDPGQAKVCSGDCSHITCTPAVGLRRDRKSHMYSPQPRDASSVHRSPASLLPLYALIASSIRVISSLLLAAILIARHLEAFQRMLHAPSCSSSATIEGCAVRMLWRTKRRRTIMLSHISLCAATCSFKRDSPVNHSYRTTNLL